MLKKIAIWTNRLLWTVMVSILIVVASYASIGRYYIEYVERYQQEIVEYVADYTQLPLAIEGVSARWSILSPVISLSHLVLSSPIDGKEVLRLESVSFQFDLFNSLLNQTFQLRDLQIKGVECSIEEVSPGKWQLQGYVSSLENQSQSVGDFDKIIDIVLSVDAVRIDDATVELNYFDGGGAAILNVSEVSLAHDEKFRRAKIKATFENTYKPMLGIVESIGDPRDFDNFTAKAYLKLDDIDFETQLPILKSHGFDLRYAQVDSEIWLDWKPQREISIQGKLSSPLIDLAAISGESVPSISDFSVHFRVEKNTSDYWSIWLPLLQAKWHGEDVEFNNIYIELGSERLDISLLEIDVGKKIRLLEKWDQIDKRLSGVLGILNPQGILENVHLQIPRSVLVNTTQFSQSIELFQLRANLNEMEVSAWKGAPAATGVSGYLEVRPKSGFVELNSKHFSMGFPTLYKDPLEFKSARGEVRWSIGKDNIVVESGPLHFTADHGPATALLALDIPLVKSPFVDPLMTLIIGFRNIDASYRNKFIPTVLNAGLREWLNKSIISGHIVNGGFVYRGSLTPGDIDDKTVQLFLNVDNTTLDYHSDWPALEKIKGLVIVDDIDTIVTTNSATLYGMNVDSTRISVSVIDTGGLWLTVDAAVSGEAKDALRVVNESALRATVGPTFEMWELTGRATVGLDLGIPLNQWELKPEIIVDVELIDSNLYIPDYNVSFSELNGPLNYHSSSGIFSNSMTALFYGKPLRTTVKQDEDKVLVIDIAGDIDMKDIEIWSRQPALSFFSGATKFDARITVDKKTGSKFTVNSNLQGVEISLPEPYGKPATEAINFALNLPINTKLPLLTMVLYEQAELQLAFDQGQARSGVLHFKNNQDYRASEFAHDLGFISVTGEVESAVLTQWQLVLEDYFLAQKQLLKLTANKVKRLDDAAEKADVQVKVAPTDLAQKIGVLEKTEQIGLEIKLRDLGINQFEMLSQKYKRTRISGRHQLLAEKSDGFSLMGEVQGWQFSADNDVFTGDLFLPDGSFLNTQNITSGSRTLPLIINLERFSLPESQEETDEVTLLDSSALQSSVLDPRSFNSVSANVSVKNLMQGRENLGNIKFDMRPLSNGIRFADLRGSVRDISIDDDVISNLSWWSDEQGSHSKLTGKFSIGNLGGVLERWKYERIIESDTGRFTVDLEWSGSPDQWQLKNSNGIIDMHLQEGRFLSTSDASEGRLKVVSIVNLASILSLQTSFSDLFESGISFDRVNGKINLANDKLSIIDSISVTSSSSEFSLRGEANMESQLLDMELIVTLPVANNLPWIAAFAGGLPVAVPVYVVSKIFQKQVKKFSSGVYSIRGDWDDPKMVFKQAFGDSGATENKAKKIAQSKKESSKGVVDDVVTSQDENMVPKIAPEPVSEPVPEPSEIKPQASIEPVLGKVEKSDTIKETKHVE